MDHQHLAPPVTLDEFRIKFKLTVGKMKKDTKIEYSIVQLHNQFKVVGLLTKSPYISTFTIDFTPDIVRRFVDCELPALVLSIKNSFYSFMQSSHSYTTPYGHHTEQTVFYYFGSNAHKNIGNCQLHSSTTSPILQHNWCFTFTIARTLQIILCPNHPHSHS